MNTTVVTASLPTRGVLWPLAGRAVWLAIPAVALVYSSIAAISLALAIPPGYATAVWPPAGIALAACVAFGPRVWPGVLLGAAIANLGVIGTPVPVALAIGAGNAAEAVLGGWMIQQLLTLRHRFDAPAAVWKFAGIAFCAAMLAATNGVATLAVAGQVPWNEFGVHWVTWWLGDATGMVIVTPLLLCWSDPRGSGSSEERAIEYRLFGALLLLAGALVLAVRLPTDTVHTLAYLMVPLVTWAAARLDQRAVTAASFVICAVAVLDLLDGSASVFSRLPLNESLLLMQLLVSAVALTGLTLSAMARELDSLRVRVAGGPAAAVPPAPAKQMPHARPLLLDAGEQRAWDSLTSTEREILRLVADGHSNAEAAKVLGLSPRTVETYRGRLMEKLQLDSLPALVKYAVRRGLSSLD